jgi:5-methylthioribose kinase
LREFIGIDKDDDDYGLDRLNDNHSCYDNGYYTEEIRKKEEAELQQLITQIEEGMYHLWFHQIPVKKNGTFAKNRVTTLWRGYSFEHYWEDSYGYGGPELVIRTLDDYTTVLQVESRVRKI